MILTELTQPQLRYLIISQLLHMISQVVSINQMISSSPTKGEVSFDWNISFHKVQYHVSTLMSLN